jgi:TonB-dependent starch-binding outer membrane protein SusC
MYKKFYKYLLVLSILVLSTQVIAQEIQISGIVTEAGTELTIPGATIQVKGTSVGTVADFDGNYTLAVPENTTTLIVSFVGYESTEIEIAGQSVINVALGLSLTQLSEVVVIGYGTQKKKVVTGSIASISAEEITSTPVVRVDQALQGRTPGVQVTNLSGQPGETPTVIIRGAGTTRNATPLYIVDGLQVDNIEYLNPGDIESMDVLKDAASAAIYGARAANGVVLITTKSGEKGKMNVSYSGYYGVQNVAKKIDMLGADDYRMMMNEGARNAGLTEPFDLNQIADHNTDWQSELFEPSAPISNHQVSVLGGGEKSTFASSLSYFSQQGIIGGDKSQFDRLTIRINSTHNVNKVFTFGNNLAYSHIVRRGISSNTSFNGAYSSAVNMDPLTPVIERDQSILSQPPYVNNPVVKDGNGEVYGISNYIGAEIVNPLALIEIGNAEYRKDELVGNVYGELEFIENLKFKTDFGFNLAYGLADAFRPQFYLNSAQNNTGQTTVSKNIDRWSTWQWENTLVYTKKINDHNFGGLLGVSAQEKRYENLSGFNAGVPVNDPDNVYLNLATDTLDESGGGATHSALFSIFGRATYDFKEKYSLTAIIRRDGSSKFGPSNRFGIFPSFGAAWVASDEDFLQNLGSINLLKVRASWGVNGNQEIGNYQYTSTILQNRNYTTSSGVLVGASPSRLPNPEIRWEESEQLDLAVDIGFFENRLTATVDYYVKKTKGLLELLSVPGHVGFNAPIANVGTVQNNGVELAINWREKRGEWNYSLGVNGAYNKNEMIEMGASITGASWAIAGPVTRTEIGFPIAYFWGYKTDGIFQNMTEVFGHINNTGDPLQPNAVPGDVRFKDIAGAPDENGNPTGPDGIIDENDRTMIGNPTPKITMGFTSNVSFKGFDLGLLITGAYGNDVFNGINRVDLQFTNLPESYLDRWTGEGTSNTLPRYTWSDVNNNNRISDLYIEDASYVRLKNIQLGYSLPVELLDKIGASAWKFYVSAENLLTLTGYTGTDPEIGAMSSFDIGIDRAIYPQARTFRVGTAITF